jgi:hypothetical protein
MNELSKYAKDGNLSEVNRLLAKDAEINKRDSFKNTPLCYACSNGHKDVAKSLISKGAQIKVKNKDVGTVSCPTAGKFRGVLRFAGADPSLRHRMISNVFLPFDCVPLGCQLLLPVQFYFTSHFDPILFRPIIVL